MADIGDGFLTGTFNDTSDIATDMIDNATLQNLFGPPGIYDAYLNVKDNAGVISTLQFQLVVNPEPASIAIWMLLGLGSAACAWRRAARLRRACERGVAA